LNLIRLFNEKVLKRKTIHDYGRIGESNSGSETRVFAKIIERKSLPRVVINGTSSLSSYCYELDINRELHAKLNRLCADIRDIISQYEQIGNEKGILENGEIPHRCANCATSFLPTEHTCSKCSKNLDSESRHIEKGDVIGYLNLVRVCNPDRWGA